MSTYAYWSRGLLSTRHRSRGNLISDEIKRNFFQAEAVLILLHGCTSWTLTKHSEKKPDRNYSRMLRAALNKSLKQHPTKELLYSHLPPISQNIQVRRTRHSGHCWQSCDELTSHVFLWIPAQGGATTGQRGRTYINSDGDAHEVMDIDVGNGHDDPSSNPGHGCLHLTKR